MEAQGDGCIEVEWYLAELATWQVIELERPANRITGLHTSLPQDTGCLIAHSRQSVSPMSAAALAIQV